MVDIMMLMFVELVAEGLGICGDFEDFVVLAGVFLVNV